MFENTGPENTVRSEYKAYAIPNCICAEQGQAALDFYDANYRTEFPKGALKSVPKELLQGEPDWQGK